MSGQSLFAPTAAQRFAAFVAASRSAQLPAAVTQAVKNFTLDTLGVGIGGARSVYAPAVLKTAQSWGEAAIGQAAHVWGAGARLPAANAAYVNAFQAHAQEFDCVHEAAVLHPFTVVVPVLMAEAEAHGLPGADYARACAVGVEIAASLGVAATAQIRFFRPATGGLFGAVAALSCARGLDEEATTNAFGYALALASGTMQAHVEGTPALAISVAAAARSAFNAVDLAAAGLPGPRGAIDGPFGYLPMFEASHDLAPVWASLGKAWRAAEVSWKPFPTGRAAHGGIAMILKLRARGLDAEALQTLTIEAPPLISHLVGRPIQAPLEVNYARLCLPYVGAVALARGAVTLADFTPERLNDPAIHALARKIKVAAMANPDPAAFTPQRAIAECADGSALEESLSVLPGAPAAPLTRSEHLAKFSACVAYGFGEPRADIEARMVAAVDEFDTLPNVATLPIAASGSLP